ncbi:HpcH/HpaI aldolase/citrate lyase family protein [Altererythrobacter lauratis]|uniref:HpcH/HpaI aldolase/citrate lyase family protein n=1 Tax=Alteraurantiacibacter lauratis TaxID=2054627 RepID=A0ABV7ECE2_9SPHN
MTSFRDKLRTGKPLIGLWQALANNYAAEICARQGFDWLLLDAEHSPNTIQTLLAQAQAIAPFPVETIVRVAFGEPVVFKQYLDLGLHSLLVPMVESAEQAADLVRYCRFPPRGIRGVSSATSRGADFGVDADYLHNADQHITLIVQIESRAGLENVAEIAAVDGVDALFIGPSDLAASLGHLGDPLHPEVTAAVDQALAVIKAAGKPAGIFAVSPQHARDSFAKGFAFASVGTDIGLLISGARAVLADVRGG